MSTVDELRARVTEKGPWFDVPVGRPDADCSRCDAEGLYWIVTTAGKKMLVDTAVPGGRAPCACAQWDAQACAKDRGDVDVCSCVCHQSLLKASGRGVAHWATCPKAAEFRKKP